MLAEICLILGVLGVACNPYPFYGALSLVLGVGGGCLVMIKGGVTFLSLVLLLIYLGGMMVVFAYCTALVAEPYPAVWGGYGTFMYLGGYSVLLSLAYVFHEGEGTEDSDGEIVVSVKEALGVVELYSGGGWFLFWGGWSLLLCLFVILEVVGGSKFGALKAV
uniref:NADH-ubiquinone oxidoreductase chain 6 n=1 Tax=Ptychadena mascareniensis TaxID=88031 RepID=S4V1B5_9NEOB|nr:NADH dehydrogenase subunit 6 [Ptychadena mascareniensis]